MKIKHIILPVALLIFLSAYKTDDQNEYIDIKDLRQMYSSGNPAKWPKPALDKNVDKATFQDIGPLPEMTYPEYNK